VISKEEIEMPSLLNYFARAVIVTLVVSGGVLAIISSGRGGGGDDGNGEVPSSGAVTYSLGAPNSALGQTPMTIDLGAAASPTAVSSRVFAAASAESFSYPSGPDNSGDTLPKISGSFDTLTLLFTQALNSKLWLDLPASAGGYQMTIVVTEIAQPTVAINAGELMAGKLELTPRQSYADLSGRIQLTFSTDATPVCIGWDSDGDNTDDSRECMDYAEFNGLWKSPDASLSLPLAVQQAAAASYAGWALFYEQFGFSVTAMRIIETYYAELQNSATDTVASTIACELYPPTATIGSYSLSWHDRNGSGSFDNGDDVLLTGSDCFSSDDFGDNAGNIISGTLELRGYERNVGAAPTFVDFAVTPNRWVDDDVVPQNTLTFNGGFTLQAPGIVNSTTQVRAYVFTADNMMAAAALAASTTNFYPDLTTLSYSALNALRAITESPNASQDLGLCRNGGTSSLIWQEGASPYPSGLSEGDTATLTLINCDTGTAVEAKVMDGTLTMTLSNVAQGDPTSWLMEANVKLDLQTVTASGSSRRLGEFSLNLSTADSVNYQALYRAQSASTSENVNGVLSTIVGGQLEYQLGCFDVTLEFNPAMPDSYTLIPFSVVKRANRIFSTQTDIGYPLRFVLGAEGWYPDSGSMVLLGFSAPECVVLGVPPTGLSGGDNAVLLETQANDYVDNIVLKLFELATPEVTSSLITTTWSDLQR
jgi:hypothetical protein